METKPKPPNDYLALSIISTILCCQVLGIVAIVYAAQVNSKYAGGDYAGAEKASKNAKTWSFIAIGSGLIVLISILIFYGAAIALAVSQGEF